jgi:3-oxoacyl-[acyl-carrier protein] reductase
MSDFLVDLAQNPQARRVVKQLGLPIPLPRKLWRSEGAWEERPLDDRTVVVAGSAEGGLHPAIAATLASAGANPVLVGLATAAHHYRDPGEAFGRPARSLDEPGPPEGFRAHALVFDATALATPGELLALQGFFSPWLAALAACGRVVVLGRPAGGLDPVAAATQRALEGFVRSLSKEIGRRGATANLLVVEAGAEDRVRGVLLFMLAARSAFVSGQSLTVSGRAEGAPAKGWVRALEGKFALVTGAARGIGEATAEALAAEGAHVVCLDRPAEAGPLSQVARRIRGSLLLADLADPAAPSQIAGFLRAERGGVDVVVHNAGVTRDKTLARMSPELWSQALGVNLEAILGVNRALLDADLVRAGGRIVCLSSISGIGGNFGQTNYAASKAGVIGYVQALAPHLAGLGITVNAVAPGFIETRLTRAIPAVTREVARRMNALKQGGLPSDVAQAVTFLGSPLAIGLTGQVLRVCGGNLVGA